MAGAESGVIHDRRMHHNRQATPDNRAIIYLPNYQRNRQNIIVEYNLTLHSKRIWLSSTA
jgi:hypothetical protein